MGFSGSAFSQDNTWRGLKIEKENRCSPYNRLEDYTYSQAIENQIVKSLGDKIYSPYSGKTFKSKEETDIEHIVSLSEAHDSGLCSADKKTKTRFASDVQNLTLASPTVNRDEKSGHDASVWLPEKNKCWFANKVIEVKKAYNLTVDSEELIALEKVISKCSSFKLVFFKESLQKDNEQHQAEQLHEPVVKKSKSNICHWKASSPYYFMTKHYQPFQDIQSCLKSGGRCPKRDFKCQNSVEKNNLYTQATAPTTMRTTSSNSKAPNIDQGNKSVIKKSRSGICHAKSSSSYSRTKNFTAYQSLELCLQSGGRCPKRDFKCQSVTVSNKTDSSSYIQKAHFEQASIDQENAPVVKKSKSGICHAKSSSSYSRTKNFTAYESLESCLNSGGRCPKRDSNCNSLKKN